MKYSESNKPLVCMMTQSTCYKGTRRFTPKGILWHSTGANNPTLKRYVQPDDNAKDRAEWLAKLGRNQYGNDWNHIDHQAGLNFWIGKLADGTVAAVQTMPWDYRPWGCGSGSKGSCNDTHIQFEICEDALADASYFNACYKEAHGDWNPGTAAQPTSPITSETPTTPTTTRYYRVRKSWVDKASQIGAFTVLQNAKNCVDANPGYAAFDDNGIQVYPEARIRSFTR